MAHVVGVDIGGTKIVIGEVSATGELTEVARYSTPARNPEAIVALTAAAVAERGPVDAVGIGVAGWLDAAGEMVRHAPNLGWRDVPFRELLAARLPVPIVVENDANAAAWGEYRFGVGTGRDDLVMVTVGTGIGGGIVQNGALYRGAFGMAGEWGHTQVVPDGEPCGCGDRGCWEQYASGRALERYFAEALAAGVATGLPANTYGPELTTAAREGDPAAVAAFHKLGAWLGVGLADIVAEVDPALIVVGGGVSETADLLVAPTRAEFVQRLAARGRPMPYADIAVATLGNVAGLVGAADLARVAAR